MHDDHRGEMTKPHRRGVKQLRQTILYIMRACTRVEQLTCVEQLFCSNVLDVSVVVQRVLHFDEEVLLLVVQ
jgi:hypothetical protein